MDAELQSNVYSETHSLESRLIFISTARSISEYQSRSIFAIIIKWVAATHLGMGMDVNGNKVFVVHSESVAFLMAPEVSAKPTRQRLTEKILRR